jgi:hypothetical protein
MSSKNKILFILILINAILFALSQVSTIRTTTIRTTRTTKTTTTLTTSQWIYDYYYDYSQTQGCFSNYFRNYLTVNSSATINPNSPDFKNYFIPFKVLKSIKTANQCCSKCGTVGKYKSCVAFAYNIKTLECQMYQITTHYEYYGDNYQYKVLIYDAQAYFMYDFIQPLNGHYSGVLAISLAQQFIH